MKNLAIIFTLIISGLFAANCGAKAEKSETKPTITANNVTNSASANAPSNLSTTTKMENDGDAVDLPVVSNANTNPGDANRKSDTDDLRGKDADDVRKNPANSNVSNKNRQGKDQDDSNKKGDADDRGRRDNDGDEDDN